MPHKWDTPVPGVVLVYGATAVLRVIFVSAETRYIYTPFVVYGTFSIAKRA